MWLMNESWRGLVFEITWLIMVISLFIYLFGKFLLICVSSDALYEWWVLGFGF